MVRQGPLAMIMSCANLPEDVWQAHQIEMILTSWSPLYVQVTPFLLEKSICCVRGKTSFAIVRLHTNMEHPRWRT